MGHLPTDPVRSALMKRVRQSGTPAELVVAKVCHSLGLSYRRNVCSLPGSPDLANKKGRWAIFVNGCYWHHHTGCMRATVPTRNKAFWTEKFRANRRRDAAKIRQLRAAGYRVVLVWECEVADEARLRSRLAQICAKRVS
ncbi:MAG: very short patch repair endonuclease [Hyphomicrobiaceae bacterium]|nr:very short patch repair endonuclease [Hyphomicrobiaceae bacterium]